VSAIAVAVILKRECAGMNDSCLDPWTKPFRRLCSARCADLTTSNGL